MKSYIPYSIRACIGEGQGLVWTTYKLLEIFEKAAALLDNAIEEEQASLVIG